MEFKRKCTSAWQNAGKSISSEYHLQHIFAKCDITEAEYKCVKIAVSAKYKSNQKPKGEALHTP